MPSCPAVWLFDLDNTLHHADAGIFYRINRRMTEFMAQALWLDEAAASHLREEYWHRYGATLAGLQKHHPHISIDAFLQYSHPLPELLAVLQPMAGSTAALAALPGRKAVFSNGPSFYVRALIGAMGLAPYFSAFFGTDDVGHGYKPDPQTYLRVCAALGVPPAQCIMVDDSAVNLRAAKALGMQTVWYGSQAAPLPFTDAVAADMAALSACAALTAHSQDQQSLPKSAP
ncbi:MAG: pyrimidine 5'-nucleotidase [Eikenella sp.]|nr:pyrimidine 5'-nucleotidase [Eikenella sp.]